MLKKILVGIAVLVLAAILIVFLQTRPSGDIDKYSGYFVSDNPSPQDSSVRVTFFGVSTLLIDDGKDQILIDGFFSRPSMIAALTGDIESDKDAIDKILIDNNINRVRAVFVTHSHYDHAFDVGYVTNKTGAILYGSGSTLNIARGSNVIEDRLQLYQPNKDIFVGDFTIRVVPSKHSPGNGLKDDEITIDAPIRQPASFKAYAEGGSYDFLITHSGKKIYIKPSPNFIPGALDSLSVDALFLGIVTVTKQDSTWAEQFYRENVLALEPSVLVPIHWDDFFKPVSAHLVLLPKFAADGEKDFDYFIRRTKEDKIDFKILQGTKTIEVFK